VKRTGLDFYHGAAPYFVTICKEDGTQHYFEWDIDPLTRKVNILEEDKWEIHKLVEESNGVVGQNIKFDVSALYSVGMFKYGDSCTWPWEMTDDTLLASHLLASNQPHSLTDLAIHYLGIDIEPYEVHIKRATQEARRKVRSEYPKWRIASDALPEMPSAKGECWKYDMWLPRAYALRKGYPKEHPWMTLLRDYSNADSAVTLALWKGRGQWHGMETELKKRDLWEIYLMRRKLIRILFLMEHRGLTVSKKELNRLEEEYICESNNLEEVCRSIANGYGFDLTLPKGGVNNSLRRFLFEVMRLPLIRNPKSKTLAPSLDKNAIDHYVATLPQGVEGDNRYTFIASLRDKRKRDTAITFLRSYRKFWLPLESGSIKVVPNDSVSLVEKIKRRMALKDWYVLHPSFNLTGTDTLRMSSSNPNAQQICFDGETEVLTRNGWKRSKDLIGDEEIAQYWKNGGRIDFTSFNMIVEKFKGDMLYLKTEQQIDMLVTPNHRCLLQDRKNLRKFDVKACEFKGDCRHIQAGRYVGGDTYLTPQIITWLCAVQADGSYHKVKGEYYGINFAFTKERKIERLRQCLKDIGVRYTEAVRNKRTWFYVKKNQWIVGMTRKLMPDKCLGDWVLGLTRESLDSLYSELFFWDGESVGKTAYYSSKKKNADWAQIVYVLSGSRAWIKNSPQDKYGHVGDYYRVNIDKSKEYSLTTNFTVTKVPWDDDVYCVTVPSSYILIRRNEKVSVTGNSKLDGFNLRRCFGPSPGREWWSLDAKNLELRIPAYEAGEKDMIEIFEKPNDPPYFGSYHLLIFDLLHPQLFKEHGKRCKDIFESTWYQWIKNGNFSVLYGAQEAKADQTYHVTGAYKKIRHRFPRIAALADSQIAMANRLGYVETIPDKALKCQRGYPILCTRSEYGKVLPTVPLNYHIQSTACNWMGIAMVECDSYLCQLNNYDDISLWYYMILNVHDELAFDFPRKEIVEGDNDSGNLPVVGEIKRRMEKCGDRIGVPTPVSCELHRENWSVGVSYD
jgi:DNA polymerase I-like protein with 3'-5' exonuclease and polymerase domains